MGTAYSYSHAAILCVQLPRESRVRRVYDPDAAYSVTDYYLRQIEYGIRVLAWQQTEDGHKGRNQPKPVPLPSDDSTLAQKAALANRAYVDSVLNKGVNNGG